MSLIDENAVVLARMSEQGDDLSQPRTVDFSFLFATQVSAAKFVSEAEAAGFTATYEGSYYAERPWDVTAAKLMVPTAVAVTDAELALSQLARPLGGQADGWGCISA
jgi:hypothetical protein